MNDDHDALVITDVLKGNKDAFHSLVKKYEKPIFNLMYRSTGSLQESEDLFQETFLKAYDRLETYRPRKKFFSWLYVIALNVVRDHFRGEQRRPFSIGNPTSYVATFDRISNQTKDRDRFVEIQGLFQALARLPLDYREAVLLHYRDGFSMRDIAEMLQLSVSGAKMRVHRGLKKLKEILEGGNHD